MSNIITNKLTINFSFINYLLFLKKYLKKIILINDGEYYININYKYIIVLLNLLKNSLLFSINSLIDIIAIDWLWKIDRFSLYYNLYTFKFNYRLFIILDIPILINNPYGLGISSISNLFSSAVWLEREVWDMFGIYFYNHPDLRRILTDYGFNGFPFRKDFPLSGYKEIRYDDTLKLIISEEIKLSQEYRAFLFINPWLNN